MPTKLKGKSRKKKPAAGPEGRKIKRQQVASPYGHGFDSVSVVQDTLQAMMRRRQITPQEYDAGVKLRTAWQETAAIKSNMDPSKTGGGGFGPRGVPLTILEKAETLKLAQSVVGGRDMELLRLILQEEWSIKAAAVKLCDTAHGHKTSQRDVEYIGKRFRDALAELARTWFGHYGRKTRPIDGVALAPDARPDVVSTGETELRPKAAHASFDRDGVFKVKKSGD